jgi:geranylgeranyl pyrophosphate synthase
MGKPVGSDLREGIVTLPVLYYLREHPEDDRIATVVARDGDGALVAEVVAAIRSSGALALARERAHAFVRRSQEALAALPEGDPRRRMEALAEYSISRHK